MSGHGSQVAPDETPRSWIGAAAGLLVVAAMLQRVGEIVYLTRLDRVLDPVRMGARSFDLWNPFWDFGAAQFQTVGYWIPFDAFFVVGASTPVPTWVVERAFIALLLVTGLWGFVRLADEFAIGRPLFRLAAGLAYITSPVVLTRVGWQSVFAMGVVFLPWVLVPLVRGSRGGSPRRAAMRSGVAIALMGGANASVTLAVLPVPLLYLLTRERGLRRARLLRWWLLAVPLATLWWVVGLVFFARYGPDVLEYTEQVEDTVALTPLFEVLRGTADWVLRLAATAPAGGFVAQRSVAIISLATIAALGLAGLARRCVPERTFLVLSLLVGVAAVGGGYGGVLGNPATEQYLWVLAGPLGAFRNVYKFQPLILLPLSLGLAHSLTGVADWARTARPAPDRVRSLAVVVGTAVVLAAGAFPLWNNMITRGPGFEEIPTAWEEARDYLSEHANGRVVVVPGVPDADFEWGFTAQLPVQWGADLAWASRSQAPLSGLESVEYLDAVERAIERGGDTRLADFLRRGGVSHVVLPSDQMSVRYGAPPPEATNSALIASGLERSASFGPSGYGFGEVHQIEVFEVADSGPITSYRADDATWLSGDIEATLQVPREVFGERPYLLVEDGTENLPDQLTPTQWIVTDGNQATTVNFGFNRNNRSYVHGANEAPFDREGSVESHTTQWLPGLESVTASSVGPGIFVVDSPAFQPWHAVDGDRATVWQPFRYDLAGDDIWGPVDPWIEIRYAEPVSLEAAGIELALGALGRPTGITVAVETDNGVATAELGSTEARQRLAVVGGPTSRLRVSIDRQDLLRFGDVVGIRELSTSGLPVERRFAVPSELDEQVVTGELEDPSWVFTRNRRAVAPLVAFDSEEDLRRRFNVPRAGTFNVLGTAVAENGPQLLRYLATTAELSVWTDSTWGGRAEVGPRNLIDGDSSTVWRSAATTGVSESRASVQLEWSAERRLSRLRLVLDDEMAAPAEVILRADGQLRRADVAPDGWVDFRALVADGVDLTLVYPPTRSGENRPIGLADVEIPAIADLQPGPFGDDEPYMLGCEDGLSVTVDGDRVAFEVETTIGAMLSGQPIELSTCGAAELELDPGPTYLDASSGSSLLTIEQIVIGSESVVGQAVDPGPRLTIASWAPTERRVMVGDGDRAIVVVNEVFNDGWQAAFDGETVPAVRIDGWRQGFVVPAGEGGVLDIVFAPEAWFEAGTIFGLVALVALVAAAAWPSRRRGELEQVAAGRPPRWATATVVVIGAIWTVGAAAVLLGPLWWLSRRHRGTLPWVAFGAFTGAGVLAVAATRVLGWETDEWGQLSFPVGLLAAVAFLSVLLTLVPWLDGDTAGYHRRP